LTKDYKKVFAKFWGYGGQHLPDTCWGCYNEPPVDIHHLEGRGMGGDPKGRKNNIRNLIALCRKCHQRTDVDKEFNEMLKERVNRFVDAKS